MSNHSHSQIKDDQSLDGVGWAVGAPVLFASSEAAVGPLLKVITR